MSFQYVGLSLNKGEQGEFDELAGVEQHSRFFLIRDIGTMFFLLQVSLVMLHAY